MVTPSCTPTSGDLGILGLLDPAGGLGVPIRGEYSALAIGIEVDGF